MRARDDVAFLYRNDKVYVAQNFTVGNYQILNSDWSIGWIILVVIIVIIFLLARLIR
jgi:hypothetical protein